jgi:hypothetical protein
MSVKIEHQTGVKAPASVVWEIVHDIERWADWNPLYVEASGAIRIGEKLRLKLVLPDQEPRDLEATVIDWTPDEAIHWKTTHVGGLVKTIRYLEIEAKSETGCIFSNGEIFTGLLGPRVAKQLRPSLRKGFTALGEAVRDLAEARWQSRQDGAT